MMPEPVPHAVLFNAGVRSLGSFGFCDLEFDIGGKKSRRRYVKATSPQGEKFSILTTTGDRYLETHHVVGIAERGPDAVDNFIAICPNCHRQAHFRGQPSPSRARFHGSDPAPRVEMASDRLTRRHGLRPTDGGVRRR
jgi:hypothetical protein